MVEHIMGKEGNSAEQQHLLSTMFSNILHIRTIKTKGFVVKD